MQIQEEIVSVGVEVNIMDQEENLKILNYVECHNASSEELKKMRGVVQDVDTGMTLFETFPYTDEYDAEEDREKIVEMLGDNFLDEWDAFYAVEGALLRVFWHQTRWYVTTNKKLNAFKSRWSSRKSFGEMFADGLVALSPQNAENVLEKMLDSMDKEYVYFFLVGYNHENRIVCQVGSPVIFIGRWNQDKVLDREWKHTPALPGSVAVVSKTTEELIKEAAAVDIKVYQGVILFHKTENRQIKIHSPDYRKFSQIRGNNPNIRFRYLEVRNDPEKKKVLTDLYPIYQDMFLEYENILYQIAKLVRYYYIQRYIKNKYVTLPKEEYILMKKCHDWYLSDREENKINVTKVFDILTKEDTLALYKMIRRYQMNQYSSSTHADENSCEYPRIRANEMTTMTSTNL
jgi:hypothetical protein